MGERRREEGAEGMREGGKGEGRGREGVWWTHCLRILWLSCYYFGYRTLQRSQSAAHPTYHGFGAAPPPAALHRGGTRGQEAIATFAPDATTAG